VRAALAGPFATLAEWCARAVRAEGKILLFGNGGSAADAQHLTAELTVRFARDRAPIAALAFSPRPFAPLRSRSAFSPTASSSCVSTRR
jgi:phosphoheptose isomerase